MTGLKPVPSPPLRSCTLLSVTRAFLAYDNMLCLRAPGLWPCERTTFALLFDLMQLMTTMRSGGDLGAAGFSRVLLSAILAETVWT